ncbi:MAG: BolA/IbaG family iron-sulfur metabolism protein [Beggiatoa sp.]|jgi:acid stress-induced BolA-like protein IbaG/YrbA|nr:BolA/IbaG family iron-sulfur metabolism protein [Beggiatoa sp.]
MTPTDIQRLIEDGIPGSRAEVRGEDGVHFEASVVSPAFRGLNPLERHRLVYQSLGRSMESAIHALSIKTLTPEEQDARMRARDAD